METVITHVLGDVSRNLYSHAGKKEKNKIAKSGTNYFPSSNFPKGIRLPLVDCLMLIYQ